MNLEAIEERARRELAEPYCPESEQLARDAIELVTLLRGIDAALRGTEPRFIPVRRPLPETTFICERFPV